MKVFEIQEENSNHYHEDGKVERLYDMQGNIDYPALLISGRLEKYHLELLRNLVVPLEKLLEGNFYYLHIEVEGVNVCIGKIQGGKLFQLLSNKIFTDFKKVLFLSENEVYEGDMLFAFCEL